ncbi:MAG: cupredoxin domain-containing protein [Rubrobacter sp.]
MLGGLFLLLRPDSPVARPEKVSFDLEILGNGMEPREVSVREGDRVTISFTADRQAEIHVHGYDLEVEVESGAVTKLSFEADSTGRFPIEDHATGAGLGFLVVEPR